MKPEEITVGMVVEYAQSPGHWFSGVVAEEPWQLGHGTWVTKLTNMAGEYAEFTHKSGDKAHTVFAAALSSLRRRACSPRPSTGHPDEPTEYRCGICGGVVHFDGTAPVAGNWGGRGNGQRG